MKKRMINTELNYNDDSSPFLTDFKKEEVIDSTRLYVVFFKILSKMHGRTK